MALTQYNEWEPVLDPVNGVMQQEPRVFAHDARVITIGAINNSHSNHGITMTSGGTGYAVGMVLSMTGGTGSNAEVTVTAVDGGVITNYTVSNSGSGYVVGDNLSQLGASAPAGGLGFTCTVSNIDIPNTQKRGCCIYVGDISGGARLDVVMEGGTAPITFNGVVAGSFLPILVKRVDINTTATSLLALY
jgi:hypothetical protein